VERVAFLSPFLDGRVVSASSPFSSLFSILLELLIRFSPPPTPPPPLPSFTLASIRRCGLAVLSLFSPPPRARNRSPLLSRRRASRVLPSFPFFFWCSKRQGPFPLLLLSVDFPRTLFFPPPPYLAESYLVRDPSPSPSFCCRRGGESSPSFFSFFFSSASVSVFFSPFGGESVNLRFPPPLLFFSFSGCSTS